LAKNPVKNGAFADALRAFGGLDEGFGSEKFPMLLRARQAPRNGFLDFGKSRLWGELG
jgi:hypothetical protein